MTEIKQCEGGDQEKWAIEMRMPLSAWEKSRYEFIIKASVWKSDAFNRFSVGVNEMVLEKCQLFTIQIAEINLIIPFSQGQYFIQPDGYCVIKLT